MAELQVGRGTSPQTLLSAAAATGAGTAWTLDYCRNNFTMQTVVTGAPTGVSVKLQGSLDNVNWYDLATSTSTTGDAQFGVDKPSKYIRANLGTLTAGTTPTVTVLAGAV